jgi:hypothetical protein
MTHSNKKNVPPVPPVQREVAGGQGVFLLSHTRTTADRPVARLQQAATGRKDVQRLAGERLVRNESKPRPLEGAEKDTVPVGVDGFLDADRDHEGPAGPLGGPWGAAGGPHTPAGGPQGPDDGPAGLAGGPGGPAGVLAALGDYLRGRRSRKPRMLGVKPAGSASKTQRAAPEKGLFAGDSAKCSDPVRIPWPPAGGARGLDAGPAGGGPVGGAAAAVRRAGGVACCGVGEGRALLRDGGSSSRCFCCHAVAVAVPGDAVDRLACVSLDPPSPPTPPGCAIELVTATCNPFSGLMDVPA